MRAHILSAILGQGMDPPALIRRGDGRLSLTRWGGVCMSRGGATLAGESGGVMRNR